MCRKTLMEINKTRTEKKINTSIKENMLAYFSEIILQEVSICFFK